jgi:hypothetical protein
VLDLRCGARDSGELDARGVEALAERLEDDETCRSSEDEVVRGRPQRDADRATPVVDDPEAVLVVERGVVAQRSRDPEEEVVPRLVLEQERSGRSDERTGIVELLDDHVFIV